MTLQPNHLSDLQASGLSDETIVAAGIFSEADRTKLAALLNRRGWDRKLGAALVFPFFDEAGATVLHRVKPDNRPQRNGKPGPKYLSPVGGPIRAYVPSMVNGVLADATRSLLLTEGEKKTLKLCQEGFPAIGLTGVDCWHGRRSLSLIADLARVEWKGRAVFIVFDSDAVDNENIRINERLLGGVLKNHGAKVKVVRLPQGDNGAKVGVDDFLIAHSPDALHKLLNESEEPEPARPDEVKQPTSELLPEAEAERFIEATKKDSHPRLVFWRDCFWVWQRGRYEERSDNEVRSDVARHLNCRYLKVGRQAVGNVMGQIQAQALLPNRIEAPSWLDEVPGSEWPVDELVVTKNKVIHLPSLFGGKPYSVPSTPALFTLSALEFRFTESSECPHPDRWLQFLEELWEEDLESIEALQLWFGYCLVPDTSQHKMLGIFGPKRSGKGTIAHVLRQLVGAGNTCAPTLGSLAGPFGLWPIIGKTLAVIGDARLSGRTDAAIVTETLLQVTGGDAMTVNRKNLPQVTVTFPTRVMMLSNELPRMTDASATIVSRMIVLRLATSWYGREDTRLLAKLTAELPAIMWWALDGWRKLQDRGKLLQPESSAEVLADLEDLASPVNAFLRECCQIERECTVARSDLYDAYTEWCKNHGRRHVLDTATFGRDLHAAIPSLRTDRHRVDGDITRHYTGVGLRPLGG